MKPATVTLMTLKKLLTQLKDGEEGAIGSYLYKGFHVQISRYKLSTSERVSLLYRRRRDQGKCVVCAKKVTKKNPRTKRPYRLCETHRKAIDRQ